MEYKKNDIVTVEITDMGADGEGIGKADGFTLFIKDAVIGDTVQAKIMKSKKQYAFARLEKVLTPSPFRVKPRCEYYRQCGGCQIQALSYEKQLAFKQDKVRGNLIRIGGFSENLIDSCMEPIVGMEEPYHYRNKAQYPVGIKDGKPVVGFYAGRTHVIIPNTGCHLGAEGNESILKLILSYMEENHVAAYDETSHSGLVRHILIRTGYQSKEIMVCLVLNYTGKKGGPYLPAQEELLSGLQNIPNMTSVSVSINTERTNVIMGQEIHTLWGSPYIQDKLGDLTFKISPLSFYQVNPAQTEKLYSLAVEYAGLTGSETVWDLYCGIGTISLFMAKKAKQVYGVEIVPQAIADARENAVLNKISNAEFFVGKAEEVLPEKYEKEGIFADVIVVDPPRKGCDSACLETMLKMRPKRIVYVSCDSATLARDLKVLCEGGYELERVRAVDQFGQTVHVETVCLLSKLNVKHHIEVEINLDEMDLTKGGE